MLFMFIFFKMCLLEKVVEIEVESVWGRTSLL